MYLSQFYVGGLDLYFFDCLYSNIVKTLQTQHFFFFKTLSNNKGNNLIHYARGVTRIRKYLTLHKVDKSVMVDS